jgi:plastocyanin
VNRSGRQRDVAGVKRLLVAALATSASLSLGTAAIAQSSPTPVAHATGARIVIKNFGFSGTFRVHRGQRVTVVNRDFVAHTLTSNTKGKFNTGRIPANGGRRTFTAPKRLGHYGFHCSIHPEMKGTLTVVKR